MWVIFILSSLAIAVLAMILFWFGNKIYLAIKKDNQRFDNDKGEK